MNNITVATVIHGYYPRVGGAETQLRALVPHLKERGIQMTILTRRYETGLPAHEVIDGIDVYRLPAPGPKVMASLAFTFSAFLKLAGLHPALVHAHEFISPATVALLAERWLNIPMVVTSHRSGPIGDVQKMQRKLFGPMRLRALRERASRFVVISDEIADELLGIGIEENRLVHITNGVDVKRFSPPSPDQKIALRSQAGFSPDAFLSVFTGRLVPEKRLDQLITIWPSIRASYPDAELLIVGMGPEEQHLRALAGEGVHFMGSTSDVLPFLQMADVFVLPSAAEGLSVALLEAMSCGLAPILTDVGGAREVVIDGENGLLVPVGDPGLLLDAFVKILGDRQALARLQLAARERIMEKFSVEFAAEKLKNLYADIAGA